MASLTCSRLFVRALLVAWGLVLAGCGGGGSGSRQLVVGDIGWDENTAIANLTKVLLEDEL